jgi:hypothetical protein
MMGQFDVAASDGLTDEAMFDYANVGIQVDREKTIAGDRVSTHVHIIEVLAWLTALRRDAGA